MAGWFEAQAALLLRVPNPGVPASGFVDQSYLSAEVYPCSSWKNGLCDCVKTGLSSAGGFR